MANCLDFGTGELLDGKRLPVAASEALVLIDRQEHEPIPAITSDRQWRPERFVLKKTEIPLEFPRCDSLHFSSIRWVRHVEYVLSDICSNGRYRADPSPGTGTAARHRRIQTAHTERSPLDRRNRAKRRSHATRAGAEIDLLLLLPDRRLWAIEVKRSAAPRAARGFELAASDLAMAERFVVYPGREAFPLSGATTAVPLMDLMARLEALA